MKPVTFHWRKYDGRAHWIHSTHHLGTDVHGEWFYQRQGEYSSRPGLSYTTETPVVFLVPTDGSWVARIFPSGREDSMKIYIDLASAVAYDATAGTVSAIDMDLDVIQLDNGHYFLDDEDEFRAHALSMSYPQALVATTKHEAARVLQAVEENREPFRSVADKWLAFGVAIDDSLS